MADLLLELFSEEIPARMQERAEQDLERLMKEAFLKRGIQAETKRTYSGPRRIAYVAAGLPKMSAATVEERKGPRVGAPQKAIEGFLRAAGLQNLDECEVVKDPKGDYYLARMKKEGRATPEIIAEIVPEVIRTFPWPKSMRWGARSLRWVRPLKSILCLFDDEPVIFEVDGIQSGPFTYGHRDTSDKGATASSPVKMETISSYEEKLLHAKVVSTREQRVKTILDGALNLASGHGLSLVEDHGLLDENAGLVEWPVVLSGEFNEDFLDVPQEILITAMKSHQKCFSLRHKKSGRLANRFILVANLDAEDGGKSIVAGNERVIRARLSDAKFFWDNDRRRPLESLVSALANVTFHEKLGSQLERVNRIGRLAKVIAGVIGADEKDTARAAYLAKADLLSETVGEFPELQGVIGRYVATAQGENSAVAQAIGDHYKPQGPSDLVPSEKVTIAVALADKLDMLAGFWSIDEKPTGSKDPFALRRAALGIIRIVLENDLRLPLSKCLKDAFAAFGEAGEDPSTSSTAAQEADLLAFFADRLKVYLRDKGARHDLIDAIFALPGQDDLLLVVRRVEALGRFLESEEGGSLLVLLRRAMNILKIEEKKDKRAYVGEPLSKLLKLKEEKALNSAIKSAGKEVQAALKAEDFEAAMSGLAKLREPVDHFFDKVTVNAPEAELRENRLELLAQIRAFTLQIADFARVEG